MKSNSPSLKGKEDTHGRSIIYLFVFFLYCQSESRSKVHAIEMECFNELLLKLREVHEREVEGKWKLLQQQLLATQQSQRIALQ